MLPGEKFKLDTPTLGLAASGLRQVLIPAKSIIEIVSVPTDYKRMVDVLWDGQPLTMFVYDLDVTEIEIAESRLRLSAHA
jgi:hypothetical protein